MDKKNLLDKVLCYLIGSNNQDIPESLDDKIELWKKLIATNKLNDIPSDILLAEDKFLRLDLINRKLTDAERILFIKDELNVNTKFGNKLSLWCGDITTIYADAVINITTSNMLKGERVSEDSQGFNVFLRSGMRLTKKCQSLLKDENLNYTDILITRAYNMPCDFIIHVVSPVYEGDITEYKKLIMMSYRNILECANNNMIKILVLPYIGLESNLELKDLFEILTDTVIDYLESNSTFLEKIVIQVNNEEEYNIFKEYLLGDRDA